MIDIDLRKLTCVVQILKSAEIQDYKNAKYDCYLFVIYNIYYNLLYRFILSCHLHFYSISEYYNEGFHMDNAVYGSPGFRR